MRLVIVVMQRHDLEPLLAALHARGYGVTLLEEAAGLLDNPSVTLLIAVEDWQVRVVLHLLRECCPRRDEWAMPLLNAPENLFMLPMLVEVGGAAAFVLPLVRYERIMPACVAAHR